MNFGLDAIVEISCRIVGWGLPDRCFVAVLPVLEIFMAGQSGEFWAIVEKSETNFRDRYVQMGQGRHMG